ncbi:MAG: heme lyase CcmF/NrfE family subunit [Dehalococcoidia bacterium]|nr:heme lyase CcmF/NrfE family subunit [Dehalococcoidia bacterium]
MAVIGFATLFLALFVSAFSVLVSFSRLFSGSRDRMITPVTTVAVACGLVSLSVLVLLIALLSHDFGIEYVWSNSSTDMSVPYLVSALWAGNEGSLLFWAWILSIMALVFVLQKKNRQNPLLPYATPVLMVTVTFFLLLLVSVANPFTGFEPPFPGGAGINPLLENPGMVFHPPLLLAGYAGFTVPFALAIAALITRKLDESWLPLARRWALFAWLLLGLGNLLGAWWAYVELGWGGYWAWDPVENSSLMPWLLATAFLHSMLMQKRRSSFKHWNIVLIILTFNLTIFGTFLTRTDLLNTVHGFGDTGMGPFFITFLLGTVLIPLGLLSSRWKLLKDKADIESLVSRESTFLLNNVLFTVITLVILLGTMFPAILELISGERIGVNEAFFNTVNGPLLLGVVLLAGLCTVIGWRQTTTKEAGKRFLLPLVLTVILGGVLYIAGVTNWAALLGYMVSAFALFAIISQWLSEVGAGGRKLAEYPSAFWRLLTANRTRYGAYIVHFSVVMMTVGIIGSSLFDVSTDVTLAKGESTEFEGYEFTYDQIGHTEDGDRLSINATVNVTKAGQPLGTLVPSKFIDESFNTKMGKTQFITEVAIRTTFAEDLYLVLSNWDIDAGTADFQVKVNPLVVWIWIGSGFFLLGGLIAFWPARELPPPAPAQATAGKKQPAKQVAVPPTRPTAAQPARRVSPSASRKKKARRGKR